MILASGCHRPTTPVERSASPSSAATSATASAPKTSGIAFHERAAFNPPFLYHNGEDSDYFAILEALGGGVATIDFDRDGWWDVMLPGGGDLLPGERMVGRPTGLYRNLGSWSVGDISSVLPESNFFSHGAAAADFDADGFTDVLITGYGAVQLLHNAGDGTFRDVTVGSGIANASWSTGAAWGDLNGDGVLDVFIANYVNWSFANNPVCIARPENQRDTCAPRSFEAQTDAVFLGLGDGTFRSALEELGFSPGGKGLGVLLVDLDQDRDLDVYVANDGEANFIYQNNGGTFTDISIISGADRNDRGMPDGSMGLEAGDFNGDGRPDLWVTNYEQESMALYRAHAGGFYQHVSQPLGIAGIGSTYVGWGIHLSDFDGDGDEDVFIATGHAIRHSKSAPRFQRPVLLENLDGRKFVNVAAAAGEYFTNGHLGRGVSGCDVDNDGRCDVIVSQLHEPAVLLENATPTASTWLGVQLVGRVSPRDPIGASVVLSVGQRRQFRMLKSGASYLSTSDSRLLFRIPDSADPVLLEIDWPSGITQHLTHLKPGRYHVVVEPEVQPDGPATVRPQRESPTP